MPSLQLVIDSSMDGDRASAPKIQLSKSKLIDYWERGILTATAYVCFALEMEGALENLDIDNFIFKWRGVMDPDSGKIKTLKRSDVLKAIATLEDKEVLQSGITQLSLELL